MKVGIIIPVVQKYKDYSRHAALSVRWQYEPVEWVQVPANELTVGAATNRGAVELQDCDYIMRLDADDWLHSGCCMVLATYLHSRPGIQAVYSDYWETDESGNLLELRRQEWPPHPACALIRHSAFKKMGGFDEDLEHQDGEDFWLRFAAAGYFANHVSLPLWYYRRHGEQMSTAHNTKVVAGQAIKEKHEAEGPRILCVIPARGGSKGVPRKNLVKVDGVPLVARAIRTAKRCKHSMLIVVSTEDEEIAELARVEGVDVVERPPELAEDDVSLIPVAKHAMERTDPGWHADIVVTLQPTAPLLKPETIDAALDRIQAAPDADSVVAVTELARHPYRAYYMNMEANYGILTPFFPRESEHYLQRQDRPKAHGFVGLYVRKRNLLEDWDKNHPDFALGNYCYGVEVEQQAGIDIDTPLDLWLAQAIVEHQRGGEE